MEKLFIEARKVFHKEDIDFGKLDNLSGKKISLAGTVQYLGLLPEIKDYLESKGKKVIIKKGAYHTGHVLGCNSSAFDSSAETLLLITDGKFHATNNAIQLQREIFVFNGNSLEKVTNEDIEKHNKKTLAKKNRFLSSEKIGIIVSSKPGQSSKAVSTIYKKIKGLGKQPYIFEADNINTNEFENFPQIQIWINTACFGLARDHNKIINLADILEFI